MKIKLLRLEVSDGIAGSGITLNPSESLLILPCKLVFLDGQIILGVCSLESMRVNLKTRKGQLKADLFASGIVNQTRVKA